MFYRFKRDPINSFIEGSSKFNDVDPEDPFVDLPNLNVMPVPPTKPKKVFLEDFENFTVK
ncbi:MAG TPA: hypothetical protein VIH61_05825 [Waddliaceae bacterium]